MLCSFDYNKIQANIQYTKIQFETFLVSQWSTQSNKKFKTKTKFTIIVGIVKFSNK